LKSSATALAPRDVASQTSIILCASSNLKTNIFRSPSGLLCSNEKYALIELASSDLDDAARLSRVGAAMPSIGLIVHHQSQ
jgi:hypothetical protein